MIQFGTRFGAHGGVHIPPHTEVDINLGYRLLVMSKTTYHYQDQSYGLGRRAIDVFSLGAVMRF